MSAVSRLRWLSAIMPTHDVSFIIILAALLVSALCHDVLLPDIDAKARFTPTGLPLGFLSRFTDASFAIMALSAIAFILFCYFCSCIERRAHFFSTPRHFAILRRHGVIFTLAHTQCLDCLTRLTRRIFQYRRFCRSRLWSPA